MSVINAIPLFLGDEGYQISRSVRLRSSASAYFNRTPASAGDRQKFTISFWMKRGTIGTLDLFTGNNANGFLAGFRSDNTLYLYDAGAASGGMQIWSQRVFRDPSAWYHIVIAVDTTQATDSNRFKVYINGIQETISTWNVGAGASRYPSLNANFDWNNTNSHEIGYALNYGYFDGYLTEFNNVSGQSLPAGLSNWAQAFGETNPVTGVWQPKKYAGTYGTNGFYLPFSDNASLTRLGFDQRPSATVYANGWRNSFNGSASLTAATNAAFAVGTNNFTIEAWIKPTSQAGQIIFVASNGIQVGYQNTTTWGLCQANVAWQLTTTTMPTLNAWNHIVVVRSGTGANQTAIFLNGTRVAQGTISTSYAQNSCLVGSGITGDLTNVRFVNGTAIYDPTQTTLTVPTAPLSNVANTAILTCQNETFVDNSSNAFSLTNSATTSARDSTFNTCNDWTTNNISLTAGATYDSMLDVPTQWADGGNGRGNYCTGNPLLTYTSGGAMALKNGNLDFERGGAGWAMAGSTIAVSTGKWYWEATFVKTGSGDGTLGIHKTNTSLFQIVGYSGDPNGYGYSASGNKLNNTTGVAYGASYTNGDVIGVALDLDAGTLTFYKNNVSQGTAFSSLSGEFFPAFSSDNGTGTGYFQANFGQRPFAYTPPSGFKALNTLNLPTPTILKGNQYFDATTYSGQNTALSVTNSGSMQPDLVWIKKRNGATDHNLTDAVRGTNRNLISNSTAAEDTVARLTSFDTGGFTLAGAFDNTNISGSTYVGWQWKKGATQGFDIVTYTGDATTNRTVAHALGVQPSMFIIKARSAGTTSWIVHHKDLGNNGGSPAYLQYLLLESTAAKAASTSLLPVAGLSSTTFPTSGATNNTNVNGNGTTYVAYLFSEVAGFSKFGSYTGNGSADGPFVFTGFRPAFILVKASSNSTTSTVWTIWDTRRSPSNAAVLELYPNSSIAESTDTNGIDILSNGFKPRRNSEYANFSGWTYIFAAFAENPFKNALAR